MEISEPSIGTSSLRNMAVLRVVDNDPGTIMPRGRRSWGHAPCRPFPRSSDCPSRQPQAQRLMVRGLGDAIDLHAPQSLRQVLADEEGVEAARPVGPLLSI